MHIGFRQISLVFLLVIEINAIHKENTKNERKDDKVCPFYLK